MPKCKVCGSRISDGTTQCPMCGAKIAAAQGSAQSPVQPAQPAASAQPQPPSRLVPQPNHPQQPQPVQPTYQQPNYQPQPAPVQQIYQPVYQQPPTPEPQKKSGVPSLVLGLLSILFIEIPILSFIFARCACSSSKDCSDGYATAGNVIGTIITWLDVIALIIVILYVVAMG